MNARFDAFARAFRSSRIWTPSGRPGVRPRISQFVCRSCQSKFSTSSLLRQIQKAVQQHGGIARDESRKYPSKLIVYNAGEMRTSFVSFWKATAIFQFGVCAVFLAPMWYWNERQPDPNVRLLQAIGITIAGGIPFILMSYLTTPFVKRIAVQLPSYARESRTHLMHWSSHLPAETRIEFTTLRAFPYERNTACFLFELRALPPQWWRFANIERAKTDEWRKRHAAKGFWSRVWEVLNEPRFKFYVKEGRRYTQKTGVHGVWENVAKTIQAQTVAAAKGKKMGGVGGVVKKASPSEELKRVKRQTARSAR